MNSPSSEHQEDPEAKADRLLKLAMDLDVQANDAWEAAREAFKALGRPLPLFDRLDKGGL